MNVTTKIAEPSLTTIFHQQRATALQLRTSTAPERIAKLRRLEAALQTHRPAIYQALLKDLRKSEPEANLTELMPVLSEIRHAARHLKSWMRPRSTPPTLAMLGTQARILAQPKGTSLIISPWNYPLGLTLGPLVSAIAAGCTAIIKPSELSPATSAILARIIAATFPADEVALFEGDASVSTALLALPFDHIFFTGSPAIGKIVMAAAAKNLSSVTLELGGKSPVIVDPSADLAKAAKSICWGKFLNAGQTCIAPDYVYVHASIYPQFVEAAKAAITQLYGADPKASPDYGRIINARHAARLQRLAADAGNTITPDETYIAPTLLTSIAPGAAIMQEEIFGPLLPILPYTDLGEVLTQINANPKPLALYVYAKDQPVIDRILAQTSSGGACVNISVLHFAHNNLPFGGVNTSGIGSAHGVFGFRAFSHERAVLRDRFSVTPMLFPPYTQRVKRLIAWSMKYFT